jgi:hypothetical protein
MSMNVLWEMRDDAPASTSVGAVVAMPGALEKLTGAVGEQRRGLAAAEGTR